MSGRVRPLSPHAQAMLAQIRRAPVPTLEVNPGVVRKLVAEGFAEIVDLPSPYKVHRGGVCSHLRALP